jgi:hypothetical protein
MTHYEFSVAKTELFKEVSRLEDHELKLRFYEANKYSYSGTVPSWAYISISKLQIYTLTEHEVNWYRSLICMESLNRCKKFEILPRLAFYF